MSTDISSASDLRSRLADLTLVDEHRLGRRLRRTRSLDDPARRQAAIEEVAGAVAAAEQRVARRRDGIPAVGYPTELPISQAHGELHAALRDHQVVVVAGETGSGKTTQLPKLCLELGRGVRGAIGHTQPRRLAARTVAARIAEELHVDVGEQVGYQVRFDDRTSDRTLVKVMTDGILLAEIQGDPSLRAYDTIILDEAHERSLAIDFLLGYLHQLLPRRPDLKLVITSATIDPARFAGHFGDTPVVEVSGRTYPVEIRYRPLEEADGEDDQVQGICDAVTALHREIPGDVLVFLSGEREIRDTADAVRALGLHDTEVLPLYSRLAAAEQQRVFQPGRGRRVVLATNVAETSLTVPGIRAVVDPGTARISRYSKRTRVQRLPIEKVSQASADQRAGRCGRVAEGVCIRLYSEEDYADRAAFTEPEILRTNLASVILQMAALGLGDVEAFPFVDPPDRRSVRDATQLLHELGAVDSAEPGPRPRLTPIGRTLARLPVDPRIGRMLVEADRNACLREVLVVAAGLSIQDPRERPAGKEGSADELHARFDDGGSDFLAYRNLWAYLRGQQRALSSNAFRRRCKAEHLHYLRVREWQDLHSQLRSIAKDLGMAVNATPAEDAVVHRSLLAGLLSHVGLYQEAGRRYRGARGLEFSLWPGSALAGTAPAWVMAGELVETSRLWARTVARIDPAWVEEAAAHLVTRTYGESRWSARRGAAVIDEKVTLYGLPLVTDRTVAAGPVDPEAARALFIRHALVEGDWESPHAFLAANRRLLTELGDLEHRTRRRDLVVDDDALVALYDARLPEEVVSGAHFDTWWQQAGRETPDLLTFSRAQLLERTPAPVHAQDHPDVWPYRDLALTLTYRFEPGASDDGVTVVIPLAALNRIEATPFGWQVPGLRGELVTALLRSLPKDLRRSFVPVPDVARAVLARLHPTAEPLTDALARELHAETGVAVPRDAWDLDRLPDHLRMTFRVVDAGHMVAQGKDLTEVKRRVGGQARAAVAQVAERFERRGLRAWTVGGLPRSLELARDGHALRGFPALVDEGDSVGVRVLLTEPEQRRAMWQGTRRLLLLELPPPARAVAAHLDRRAKLALTRSPHASVSALLDDCAGCSVDALMADHGGPAWDDEAYAKLRAAVAGALDGDVLEVVCAVQGILVAAGDAERALAAVSSAALAPAAADARAQLGAMIYPGFVTATGRRRLPDVERYVRAIAWRVGRLGRNVDQDADRMARVAEVAQAYAALRARAEADPDAAAEIRWMIEELRVSLFAQPLGTRHRVSEQRILRAIDEAAR
ncbi:MAG: ATP-dependent RNA helicase HrpA [Egibacteraceae bacterium]